MAPAVPTTGAGACALLLHSLLAVSLQWDRGGGRALAAGEPQLRHPGNVQGCRRDPGGARCCSGGVLLLCIRHTCSGPLSWVSGRTETLEGLWACPEERVVLLLGARGDLRLLAQESRRAPPRVQHVPRLWHPCARGGTPAVSGGPQRSGPGDALLISSPPLTGAAPPPTGPPAPQPPPRRAQSGGGGPGTQVVSSWLTEHRTGTLLVLLGSRGRGPQGDRSPGRTACLLPTHRESRTAEGRVRPGEADGPSPSDGSPGARASGNVPANGRAEVEFLN